MPVKFEIITMAPENTNSVLMINDTDAVIFDAWGRVDDWVKLLDDRGLKLGAIYTTHGHGDHISAAPGLAAHYHVPWYLNPADRFLIEWSHDLLQYFHMPTITPDDTAPTPLTPGTSEILGARCDIIDCPGHSPGGMAFYFPDYGVLIIGDTLFANGMGRCDLPGGNQTQIMETITRLGQMNIPDETFVISGHGFALTWGEMRRTNPILRQICGATCACGHHHDGPCCQDGNHCPGDTKCCGHCK